MSSRHQKEKRLRPQRDPYKRNHFDQSKYIGVSVSNKPNQDSSIDEVFDQIADEDDFDEFE